MTDNDFLDYDVEKLDDEEIKTKKEKTNVAVEYAERKSLEHIPDRSYQEKYNAKKNRKEIDDPNKRKKHKEKTFGNKKTTKDPYTGETIHSSSKAAQKKYKSKAGRHSAQTDHTVPCEQVWNRNKNNPFLHKEDLKEIANVRANYKQINQKTNQEKGGKTNYEYVKEKLKKGEITNDQARKMLVEGAKAEVAVGLKTAELTSKRANEMGIASGKEAAKDAIIYSSLEHGKNVFLGEEDIGDATLGIAVDTAETFARAYAESIVYSSAEGSSREVADFIQKIGERSSNRFINEISQKASDSILENCTAENFGKTAVVVNKIWGCLDRNLNGEIDDEELVNSLAEAGIEMAAGEIGEMASQYVVNELGQKVGQYIGGTAGSTLGPVGTAVGTLVGKAVGWVVTTVVCACLKAARNKALGEEYKRKAREFKAIAERNRLYRIELENSLNQINETHRQQFHYIFEEMHDGIVNNNSEQVTESLKALCDNFGVKVAFENETSFKKFMYDPKAKLIL
ncbi:hypothetical protein SAMN04487771_105210 [[Clostridium] aminophilum]|uniref:EF-hand domain-containing protein n=1 Tax=[Clostridium] aminophilum TaxID=1526 RepID=A0A1I0HMS9_9FIRM|nr:hypothetical protein [[Clostridium] aminophilum]SET84440.1 hypothetical protein SAMN04487771_105210 [[Clostridium] aminophilum]